MIIDILCFHHLIFILATDQADPTKGVSLTYFGDYCEHPVEQRKFIVDLVCDDRLNPSPSHAYEVGALYLLLCSADILALCSPGHILVHDNKRLLYMLLVLPIFMMHVSQQHMFAYQIILYISGASLYVQGDHPLGVWLPFRMSCIQQTPLWRERPLRL